MKRNIVGIGLVSTVLFLSSLNSYADNFKNDKIDLVINLASKHLGTTEKYNEENFGLGVTYRKNNIVYDLGFYNNSFNRNTSYLLIGKEFKIFNMEDIRVGISGGVATGYKEEENILNPFVVAPIIRYKSDSGYGMNLLIIPPINKNPSILGFQLTKDF